jgi:hypothetical protein
MRLIVRLFWLVSFGLLLSLGLFGLLGLWFFGGCGFGGFGHWWIILI